MNDDSGDVRKSVGIDKEGGLVFALDTMQVILVIRMLMISIKVIWDSKSND